MCADSRHLPSARAPCAHGRLHLKARTTTQSDVYAGNGRWSASMAVDAGCCVTANIRACSLSVGTFLFPSDISDDVHSTTRILASALTTGVTAAGLRARGTLLDESKPLSMNTPLQPESTVTQSTSCCSHKGEKLRVAINPAPFKGICGRKRPPHTQHHWSCLIEKRILQLAE